jgi:hypothetical protein
VECIGLLQIVWHPTRGANVLDRLYVTDTQYDCVRVMLSTVRSDHKTVIASTNRLHNQVKTKTAIRWTFRR